MRFECEQIAEGFWNEELWLRADVVDVQWTTSTTESRTFLIVAHGRRRPRKIVRQDIEKGRGCFQSREKFLGS